MSEDKERLSVRGVTKSYCSGTGQATTALCNVSFDLKGGLYGLLGPNGSGKSTLMNIITGGLKPTEGTVFWNGKTITSLGREYRRILGFAPQQQDLYRSFTGRRFLEYFCLLKEIPKYKVSSEIDALYAKNREAIENRLIFVRQQQKYGGEGVSSLLLCNNERGSSGSCVPECQRLSAGETN